MLCKKQIKLHLKENKQLLLNLGCGPVQPKGWINADYSNRAWLARYFPVIDNILTSIGLIPSTEFSRKTFVIDVRKRLPFETSTVSGIYIGELLEHILPEEAKFLIKECMRILIPGSHLRIHVPDNYEFWKRYCDEHHEMLKKPHSSWSDEYSTKYVKMFFGDICVKKIVSGSMGHYHKWAYDEVALTLLFKRADFVDVKRRELYDSEIPDIRSVESKAYLVIEGEKPIIK